MSFSTKIKGFTLIELIIVIAIIGILASIVVVAINPAQQFQRARDTQRKSDVTSILSAIGQYQAENDKYLASIATVNQQAPQTFNICKDANPCPVTMIGLTGVTQAGTINDGSSANNISTTYISNMPTDPRMVAGSLSCTVSHSDITGVGGNVSFLTNGNSTGYLLTVGSTQTGLAYGAPYTLKVWSPCAELAPVSATR